MIRVEIVDNKGEVSEIKCNRLELRDTLLICGENISALINLSHAKRVEITEVKE